MQRTGLLATIARLTGFYAVAVLVVVTAVLLGTAGNANADQATPAPAAVCTTDADCAAWDAAHGITSDGGPVAADPSSDDIDAAHCSTEGNMQCGIGTVDGPILEPSADGGEGYTCPIDANLRQNELGLVVCDFTRSA